MTDILAQNLTEKGVMRNDGKEMGTLENITVDLKTGKLESIVVKPGANIVKSDFQKLNKDSEGNFLVPVSFVESVTDNIMVRDGDVMDNGAGGPADRRESAICKECHQPLKDKGIFLDDGDGPYGPRCAEIVRNRRR